MAARDDQGQIIRPRPGAPTVDLPLITDRVDVARRGGSPRPGPARRLYAAGVALDAGSALPADVLDALGQTDVAAVWLFGSRAGGRPRADSDADVAVLLREGAPTPGLLAQARLADLLAEALDVPRVDLLLLDGAPLELQARVVLDGRLLVPLDDVRRVRWTVLVQSRWNDVRPAHEEQTRAYLRAVAAGAGG